MTIARSHKLLAPFIALAGLVIFSSNALAAAPDGMGPWADSVKSASQGLRKDGSAVPAPRSDQTAALGVAEDNTSDGTFYSLGFGGVIELGFDNGISSGVILVEATNAGYPEEKVKVEVSENGVNWVNAGEVTQDGQVAKPDGVTCAKYVRITDISNKDDFTDGTADGYDVDGVKAEGDVCVPPTPPCTDSDCCNTNVTQTNTSVVTTIISSSANTGGNKANNNAKNTTIKTGKAKSKVTVAVGGNTNIAEVDNCCGDKNTNVVIKNNGKKSKNTVNIHKSSKKN
ncbi:MAG: hypothetical protein KA035_01780 [Candidatus Levybacteria bacterium]|nr:hypothetical protein [Candidatus Levybacteria bacterium]